MLKTIQVQNFRSIDDATVEFKPITIFFGPTSSGKSSLFYAIMVLRNFILNPTKPVDGLFDFSFLNLGGFNDCVFNHSDTKSIGVIANVADNENPNKISKYGLKFKKNEGELFSQYDQITMNSHIPIPYSATQSWSNEIEIDGVTYSINWNGFTATVVPKEPTDESQSTARILTERINYSVEAIKRIDICPQKRGFFKPSYSPTSLSQTPTSEDEVATLIINDQNAAPRISINTLEIFDRDFRTFTPSGTATTYLQTTEQTGARVPSYLVNDGFGVNQVIYILSKIHRPNTDTILIEEPEVHLHPTVIRKFARSIIRLANEEQKQLAFTTHSAQFLLSILACVKEGLIQSDNVACYNVKRERRKSLFEFEEVNSYGQISGGLKSFLEGELQDIKSFLEIEKND